MKCTKTMTERLLALTLSVAMAFSAVPTQALAEVADSLESTPVEAAAEVDETTEDEQLPATDEGEKTTEVETPAEATEGGGPRLRPRVSPRPTRLRLRLPRLRLRTKRLQLPRFLLSLRRRTAAQPSSPSRQMPRSTFRPARTTPTTTAPSLVLLRLAISSMPTCSTARTHIH